MFLFFSPRHLGFLSKVSLQLQQVSRGSLWRKNYSVSRNGYSRSHFEFYQQNVIGQPRFETHSHLMKAGEITPGITATEFEQRRKNLVKQLPDSSLIILPGASLQYRTNDIPVPFRQHADLFYFVGLAEPDCACIIEIPSQNKSHGEDKDFEMKLFCPKRDPKREIWDGPRVGVERLNIFGGTPRNSFDIVEFPFQVSKLSKSFNKVYVPKGDPTIQASVNTIENLTKNSQNVCSVTQRLRMIKSEAEIDLMRQANLLSSKGFKAAMVYESNRKDGMVEERSLHAIMEMVSMVHGAYCSSYPPVVAGGNRANTIHYVANDQLIRPGELILMDAGCDVGGYTADISRTWPVSGQFSPAQRDLYEAVLRVQEKCIELCSTTTKSGKPNTLHQIHVESVRLLCEEMLDLGLITTQKLYKMQELYPHGIGHYLGIDVHDTSDMSTSLPLEENMVVTIEPGIYVDALSDFPEQFRSIGIRIEDNIVVGKNGPKENLTAGYTPKKLKEIEELIQTFRSGPNHLRNLFAF